MLLKNILRSEVYFYHKVLTRGLYEPFITSLYTYNKNNCLLIRMLYLKVLVTKFSFISSGICLIRFRKPHS